MDGRHHHRRTRRVLTGPHWAASTPLRGTRGCRHGSERVVDLVDQGLLHVRPAPPRGGPPRSAGASARRAFVINHEVVTIPRVETALHDGEGLGVLIHQNEATTELARNGPRGAATGEEVQYPVALV